MDSQQGVDAAADSGGEAEGTAQKLGLPFWIGRFEIAYCSGHVKPSQKW